MHTLRPPHHRLARRLLLTGAVLALVSVRAVQPDGIVAAVGNEVMTLYDLRRQVEFEARFLELPPPGESREAMLRQVAKRAVQSFVERELVYAEFKSLGVSVPSSYVDEEVDRVIVRVTGGDRPAFERLLAEKGTAYAGMVLQPGTIMEEFETAVEKNVAIRMLIGDKTRRGIRIPPADVRAWYGDHPDDYTRPAKVRLQVIYLKADGRYADTLDKVVKEIFDNLKAGTAFGELARTYSEGMNAAEGGIQEWKRLEDMDERLRSLTAGLAPGAVCPEALRLGRNTYIVRLADRKAGGVRPLDEALQQEIEDQLRRAEENRRYEQFLAELRSKYAVKDFYEE